MTAPAKVHEQSETTRLTGNQYLALRLFARGAEPADIVPYLRPTTVAKVRQLLHRLCEYDRELAAGQVRIEGAAAARRLARRAGGR